MNLFADKGIHFKFAVALFGVITLIMAVFFTGIILLNVRTIDVELAKRLDDASKLSQLSLSSALWQFNHDYVDDFVDSLFLYDDVVFVSVFSAKAMLKEKFRPGIGISGFRALSASPDYMAAESQIQYKDQRIGKVQIVLTRQRIKTAILNNTRTGILLLILMLAAILAINLLITRRLVFSPIRKLRRAAIEIAKGDLEVPIDTSATDEIGHLAKAFDHMMRNIKEVTASRDELNAEIERRTESEKALRQERDRAQNYLDIAGVMMMALDKDQRITLINKKGCDILGLPEARLLGMNWMDRFIAEDQRDAIIQAFKGLMTGSVGLFEYHENEIVTHKGERRLIAWHNTLLRDDAGGIVGTLSSGEDITERKQAETQLFSSLQEKEVLLREVHHRVKNNMQMIQSLLDLQVDKYSDQRDVAALLESKNRIRVMALVHERLYRSDNLADINLQEYFDDLAGYLVKAFWDNGKAISLKVTTDPVRLTIDKVVACGLIVNELVTNAMKYAFDGKAAGVVRLALTELQPGAAELVIGDNGRGLPENFSVDDSTSLGLRLVRILAETNLNGRLSMDQRDGLEYRIQFPV